MMKYPRQVMLCAESEVLSVTMLNRLVRWWPCSHMPHFIVAHVHWRVK